MKIINRIFRLFKISVIFYHYGIFSILRKLQIFPLWPVNLNNNLNIDGDKLTKALEALGPVFVKLGQTLSARPDLVGELTAKSLTKLQDKLAPFEFIYVKNTITHELGKDLKDIYKSFDEKPVAAASIAQVHKAVTIDGRQVAVKILRPNIKQIMERDIDLLFWLAAIADKRMKKVKRLRLVEVITIFAESTKIEIDLRLEAAAATELKANFVEENDVHIPEVDWERTSRNILTIEWVNGISIEHKEILVARGYNLTNISTSLARSFFNQAYRDGFFHADLHPGNIFINDQGKIVLIDFGIMGRLDKQTRIYLAEIIRGFLQRDYLYVAKLHFAAGYVPRGKSVENFAQACRAIGEPIIGKTVSQISIAKLLGQLFKVTEDFQMETQPQLLLLQKTMVLVEGIGARLDPNANMWQLAEPWIENWAIHNISPEAKFIDNIKNIFEVLKNKVNDYDKQPLAKDKNIIIYKEVKDCRLITILLSVLASLAFIFIIKKFL